MPKTLDIQGVGSVEIPDEATPEQIQSFLDENYNKPKTSALGAAGRWFGTSILPTGAGMAAAAPLMPYATAAAPATYGLSYLVPLAVGAGASWLASKAQEPVLKSAFPEMEGLQQADIQQHPYAAMGGRLAAVAPFAELAPGQGISALASIPKAIMGSPEARRQVGGLGLNIGLQEAMTAGQSLATTGKLPTGSELAESAIAGTVFGKMRGPLGTLAGHGGPSAKRPESSPEIKSATESSLLEKAKDTGNNWKIVDDLPEDPRAVAHTLDDGSVLVSRKNLHNYLDQDLRKGVSRERAIQDLIDHETTHGSTPDELAQEFVDSMSKNQKYFYRRRYLGPGESGQKISDLNLGKEAIRYELQRASEMGPSEYISHTRQEKNVVKFLDMMDRAYGLARKMVGKDAAPAQKAILDKVKANLEAAKKGAPDARSITSTEGVPQPEEGARVGEETRVRQQGETTPAQGPEAPVAQGTQIPLKPQAGRGMATIKDPPVVKDVPPGSIHPDSIVPAIRLINGDVIHGWIKEDGTAATHPEIAKRYGITVEELDRKGWIAKDGSAFYEREPAAKGTQLPTEKKAGELHSTDKPPEKKPGIDVPRPDLSVVDQPVTDREFSKYDSKNFAVMHAGTDLNTGDPLYWIVRKVSSLKSANPPAVQAPPSAPTGEAQPGQAPAGLATAPPAALTAGGPAAGTTISRTPATVKEGRLGELQQLLREPGRIPSSEEWEDYRQLTKDARAKSIAEAKARRSAPAMIRKGIVSDEEVAANVDSLFQVKGAQAAFGEKEREVRSQKMAGFLLSIAPEKRAAALDRFQTHINNAINDQAQKFVEQNTTPEEHQENQQADAQAEQLREQVQQQTGMNLMPTMPMVDRQWLDSGMIAHLNKKPEPRPATPRLDPKTGQPIVSKEPARMDWIHGDYNSYVRSIRHQEKIRFDQTGEEVHIPEQYIRDAWNENVNDFLNNASAQQIVDLLRVYGKATVETEASKSRLGKTTNVIGEVDASGIIQRIDRKYPDPGTEEFEKYKADNGFVDDEEGSAEQKAIDQIQQDKDAAKTALSRFAKVRRISVPEAEKQLRDQIRKELEYYRDPKFTKEATGKEGKLTFTTGAAEAREQIGVGKVQREELRKGSESLKKRRLSAISWLSEQLLKPSRPPEKNPLRNTIEPDDIDRYTTLTPQQASNVSLLRQELWRGTSVKGKTVSKFTKGVLILVDPRTGQHDAVSFYQHPTTKDIMVNDPRFLPGDRTQKHADITNILGRGLRIEALAILNDPVTQLHQRWKTKADFMKDIGTLAKAKETLSGLEWTKWQREQKARERTAEEKASALETQEAAKPVTEEELAGLETEKAEPVKEPEPEEEVHPEETQEGLPETKATGDKRLLGPGHNELAIDKTDPKNLARGPLTSAEAESIAKVFAEHETGRNPITKPTDMLGLLKRIQFSRSHVSWFSGKPRGLRGQDYAFASGLDKMARFWYLELVKDNQEALSGFERIPKNAQYDSLNNNQKAHWDFREDLKKEALMTALDHIYELAQESKKKGVSNYEASFRAQALEVYGEHSRRDAERLALSQERAPEESGQRSLLAGSKYGGASRALGPVLSHMTRQVPGSHLGAPPFQAKLPPTQFGGITGEHVLGTQDPPPRPEAQIPANQLIRQVTGGFVPSGFPKNRNLLRAPGTEQLLLRKIAEQSRGGPENPAMIRKGGEEERSLGGVGVANRVRAEMAKRGVAAVTEGTVETMNAPELIEMGKSKWVSWEDTLSRMHYAQESGLSDWSEDPFIARYGQFQLDQKADKIARSKGINSPEFEKALKDSNSFAKMFKDIYKTRASQAMLGFQGEVDPVTSRMTFIRHLENTKGRKLTHEETGEVDDVWSNIDDSEEETHQATKVVSDTVTKAATKPLDKGNQTKVSEAKRAVDKASDAALGGISDLEMPAMAAKGPGAPKKLPDVLKNKLTDVGVKVMMDLSDAGDYTDARWMEEMQKIPKIGHKFDDFLGHIQAESEKKRDAWINNIIGTGDPTADARKRLTRKKPTVAESKQAIIRALEVDPTGKRISPSEAYHIWNYLKQTFFDKGVLDFKKIRMDAAAELSIKDSTGKITDPYTQLRLFRAMTTNRSMRVPTEKMITAMQNEAKVKGQAANWLKNQEFPGWLRTMRLFPRLFFFDKIMGHGLVPMITHAPTMMFNPQAWSVYFGAPGKKGAWGEMYRMTFGTLGSGRVSGKDYHQLAMDQLTSHERFDAWKKAGLQADPFKYTDDYQIEGLQKVFGKHLEWMTAGRGFDALKTLRYAMAEKWLDTLPEHLRNKESMELIADSVNHATGIVKTRFHESLNWAMFAPKLEASRWAYIFKDTTKAANYIANWKTSTMEQRAWATSEMKQKAMIVGWYYGMLALNQAFLKMTGDKEDINAPFLGKGADPFKADFMAFKVAGFKVGVASPFIGMVKLFANTLHTAFGERTKFERLTQRQDALKEVAGSYVRGKFSPLASFTTDVVSGQDYAKRPIGFLPWSEPLSRAKMLRGETPYTLGEDASETFAPIPIEEAVKNTFMQSGMSKDESDKLIRTLIIAGGMTLTGARMSNLPK